MKLDIFRGVPNPHRDALMPEMLQRGWWISDNVMQSILSMAKDWEIMDDTCINGNCNRGCGYDESFPDNCEYGEFHGRLCVFIHELKRTVESLNGEDK